MNKIHLNSGEYIYTKELLRDLPKKRKVYHAKLSGVSVLAKQFFGKNKDKYFNRELKGTELLLKAGASTPKLILSNIQDDFNILIFEYIKNAESVEKAWKEHESNKFLLSNSQKKLIQNILKELIILYENGVYQKDFHLDNLLITNQQIYFIDTATIASNRLNKPLSTYNKYKNLALFFAQFSPSIFPLIPELITTYFPEISHKKLLKQSQIEFNNRFRKFSKKLARNSTNFSFIDTNEYTISYKKTTINKDIVYENILPYIQKNNFPTEENITIRSNWNNIIECTIYPQLERSSYPLSHPFKKTNAWRLWMAGNWLSFLNIPSTKPIAVIIPKQLKNNKSFVIFESLGDKSLTKRLENIKDTPLSENEELALVKVFQLLTANMMTHKNMTTDNFIWYKNRWNLVNLDELKKYKKYKSFNTTFLKDMERFQNIWRLKTGKGWYYFNKNNTNSK